jgi:tetratricopeptide (TPR) repeat protein/DNA-binding CsgD family transcriptional regulator
MAASLRNKALYQINRAIQASSRCDTRVLISHVATLAELTIDYPRYAGYVTYLQALVAKANGQVEMFRMLAAQALEELTSLGDGRAAAQVVLNMGRDPSSPQQSLAYAERARRMFEKCSDPIGVSNAMQNVGALLAQLGQYKEGQEALEQALEIKRRNNDTVGAATVLLNIASCALFAGDYTVGILRAAEAVVYIERIMAAPAHEQVDLIWQTHGWEPVPVDCSSLLATAYNNYGNALSSLGELDRSIECYGKARTIMCEIGNITGEAMVLNQIGEVMRKQGEFERAEELYRRSVYLFEESGTHGYMSAVAHQSVGEVCAAQRKFAEAAAYYDRALTEYRGASLVAGEAEVYLLLGEIAIDREDFSGAVDMLKKALSLAMSISAEELIVRGNRALGTAMMHVDSKHAPRYLKQALLLAEQYGMKLEKQNIHREFSTYYKLIGKSTDALLHFEKFYALQQEIFTENADRRLKNMEIVYQVEQHKRSVLEMKARVNQIENELEEKTRELGGLAEHIMQRQGFIKLMETGLTKIINADPDHKDGQARALLKSIHALDTTESDTNELVRKFLIVHREFAEKLLAIAPTLTPAELQVCVLTRLAMSAKDIGNLLETTSKTVNNQATRIRVKLKLASRQNLKTYLIQLGAA